MKIEQFGCRTYGDIEKAPCGRRCICKGEASDTVGVCSELRLRYVYPAKDYLEEKKR